MLPPPSPHPSPAVLALICGWGPVESYVRVGQVYQLPRAVLATGLALLSAGMAFLGLLLHAINWRLKELHCLVARNAHNKA